MGGFKAVTDKNVNTAGYKNDAYRNIIEMVVALGSRGASILYLSALSTGTTA